MAVDLITQMRSKGELLAMPTGEEGVPVSVLFTQELGRSSRAQRKQLLVDAFTEAAAELEAAGARVDLGAVNVTTQTLSAVVPAPQYARVAQRLRQKHFEVEPVVKVRITR